MEDKIALCFLTYDNLSKPELWKTFINSKYNIYIHNKNNFEGDFQKYCIKDRVDTKWGEMSLVHATLKLFQEAYKIEENKYFVLLSDTTIPLYTASETYNLIKKINNNLISTNENNKERYNGLADKNFFDRYTFIKQSQWMLLKRDCVKFFLENDYTNIFGNRFKIPDEHYFINIMNKFNIHSISKCVTYVNWPQHQCLHPKLYLNLTNNIISDILNTNALFMRKVHQNCELPHYFNKFKPLKFIHITKNAGTSIEELGKKNNILWGKHHKEYGWWHEPFFKKPHSIKSKYNWFAVVRNPYTRIISEFYCKWGTFMKKSKKEISVEEFNAIIKNKILDRNNKKEWWVYGHYLEQYLYIDMRYKIHILKLENIKEEFENLMNQYSLDIKLDVIMNKNEKQYTIDNLSRDVIDLINVVYDRDFKMFGYKKL